MIFDLNKVLLALILLTIEVHSNDEQVEIDEEEIKSRLRDAIGGEYKIMTPIEKVMYFIQLHDYDKNNLIDGLELLSSLTVTDHPREFILKLVYYKI